MERTLPDIYAHFNGAATLSLRKYEVRPMGGRRVHVPGAASMGPQLYRCGNLSWSSPGVDLDLLDSLQWGRNFIVAEITERQLGLNNAPLSILLQWGRNFIVAEIVGQTVRVSGRYSELQ